MNADPDTCVPDKNKPELKYSHSWIWKWDIAGRWTDLCRCQNCGEEREMKRDEKIDGYTGKWRGEAIK